MSYTKQTWVTGDTITAEKLNHIEQGIVNSGGGISEPLVVNEIYDEISGITRLDVTFGVIFEALHQGRNIILNNELSPSFDYHVCGRAYIKRFEVDPDITPIEYTYSAGLEFGDRSYGLSQNNISSIEDVNSDYPIFL